MSGKLAFFCGADLNCNINYARSCKVTKLLSSLGCKSYIYQLRDWSLIITVLYGISFIIVEMLLGEIYEADIS